MYENLTDPIPSSLTCCPNCEKLYKFTDLNGLFVPLILQCHHNCCENCVRDSIEIHGFVLCRKCGVKSTPKNTIDRIFHNLRENFPLAEPIINKVIELEKRKFVDESKIGFASSNDNFQHAQLSKFCFECSLHVAECFCDECKTHLCNKCFQRIHSAKTLQNHRPISISSLNGACELVNVDEEARYQLKDPDTQDKVKELHEKCSRKLIRVENALKVLSKDCLLKETKPNSLDFRDLFQKLTEHFTMAHNAIALKQQKVMQQFNDVENSVNKSMKNCEKQLKLLRQGLNNVINDTLRITKENSYAGNLSELFQESEKYLGLPETVFVKHCVPPEKPIKFTDKWKEVLEEEWDFDFGSGAEYCLINSFGTLPLENKKDIHSSVECLNDVLSNVEVISTRSYVRSEISDEGSVASFGGISRQSLMNSQVLQTRSLAGSEGGSLHNYGPCRSTASSGISRNVSKSNRSYSGNNSVPKNRNADFTNGHVNSLLYQRKDISQRSQKNTRCIFKPGAVFNNVHVSYVDNLSHFYVQLNNANFQLSKYKTMFDDAMDLEKISLCDLNKGQLYLALCSNNTWYRVRVVGFSHNRNDENLSCVTVFLVDVGNEEEVLLSNMRKMDSLRRTAMLEPELAFSCCLYDCFPENRATWSKTDIEAFENIVTNNKIDMQICKIVPARLEVDLRYVKDGHKVSIREFFVYSDRARFCPVNQHVTPISAFKDCKLFFDKDYKVGDWIDMKISHVNNPSDFYIQRVDSDRGTKSFNDLINRMNNFFKSKDNYLRCAISHAVVGCTVAAQFKDDNKWYRAQIIDIRNGKRIQVQYVDFGNTEWLSMCRVRGLSEEFCKITVQAVRCGLKDVEPLDDEWSKEAITHFVKCVKNKTLKMVVQEQTDNLLLVALFENADTKDVKCVNEDLVENGFAKGTGANASIKPLVKQPTKKPHPQLKKASLISSKSSSEVADEERIEEPNPTDENTDENRPSDVRYQVNIVNCINPNLMYFSLLNQQATLVRLKTLMTNFYRDEKNNKDTIIESVNENTKCAVYIEKDKKWCRGVVLQVIDCEIVKVFLNDYAVEDIVNVKNLRSLPEEFMNELDGALRCSLAGIEPRENWPSEICEMLKTQLSNFKELYIVSKKKGNEGNSLNVELWGKNVVCSGPLDPNVVVWTKINKLLVKKKLQEETMSEKEDYEPPFVENLKKFEMKMDVKTSKDNVAEWLQSSVSEARLKGVEYESLVTSCTPHDENGLNDFKSCNTSVNEEDERDVNIESVSDIDNDEDWLPAHPLQQTHFYGMPTYVDSDFNVYVQIHGTTSLLDIISNGLDSRYQNSQALPSDMHWLPDQICVAWYFLDRKWYRGKVKEVDHTKNLVLVEYVDFGNIEWLQPMHLRKHVALLDVPIQCQKFSIRSDCVSTASDKVWPTSVLEFVHVTVVEKKCEITLRQEKNENFYRIEKLIIPENFDLFELLYQLNHAVCTSSTNEVKEKTNCTNDKLKISKSSVTILPIVDETNTEDDSSLKSSVSAIENASSVVQALIDLNMNSLNMIDPSTIVQVTDNNELLISNYYINDGMDFVTVEVTEILDLNQIVVNIISCDTDAGVNESRKLFLELCQELQTEAVNQPYLKPPYRGRMCCTTFEDGNWYRALIIGECASSIKVPVYYIDYGNISTVSVSQLHQLKPPWYHIPAQGIRCFLEGIVLPKNSNVTEKLAKKLSKKLLNNEFKALIQNDPSTRNKHYIKLMNEDGTVPYQSIIDKQYN